MPRKQSPFQRSLKSFLNKTSAPAVFMNESERTTVEQAIFSEAATMTRTSERSEDAAIELLVRQHSRLVYGIAYAVLRSRPDAEDATQETFLRVLRYSHKLAAVETPRTWLARIAWRVAVDRSAQHGRRQEIPIEDCAGAEKEIACPGVSAQEAVQGSQVSAALERWIAALPRKLRAPLILSTVREMAPREIAATLNINEAAVRSRIFRARQILKQKLAEHSLRRQR